MRAQEGEGAKGLDNEGQTSYIHFYKHERLVVAWLGPLLHQKALVLSR